MSTRVQGTRYTVYFVQLVWFHGHTDMSYYKHIEHITAFHGADGSVQLIDCVRLNIILLRKMRLQQLINL